MSGLIDYCGTYCRGGPPWPPVVLNCVRQVEAVHFLNPVGPATEGRPYSTFDVDQLTDHLIRLPFVTRPPWSMRSALTLPSASLMNVSFAGKARGMKTVSDSGKISNAG